MSAGVLFLLLYFASGFTGLVYEVVWARLLALHMGHTVAAVSTVLAGFMGGLAAGAALAGRYVGSLTPQGALRAYAGLELAVAGAALLLAPALAATAPLLALAYADGEGGVWFGVTRAATSVALVSLPAAALGATFPLAVRWWCAGSTEEAPRAGFLYAVNTLGAALGAAAAGFLLIPAIGLRHTTLFGAAVNVAIALVALRLARVSSPAPAAPPRRSGRRTGSASPAGPATPPVPLWLPAAALTASGFVALSLEVVWTRALALVVGPTTHAFSLILVVFITGIAAGSFGGSSLARRVSRPMIWLGAALVAAGGGALIVAGVLDRLPLVVAGILAEGSTSYGRLLALEAALAAALILPAAAALGAAFPLALASSAGGSRPLARGAAILYATNTAGAIAGALVGGFVLLPALGLQRTSLFAALAAVLAGYVLLASRASGAFRMAGGAAVAASVLAAWLLPPWNTSLLTSGAYKYSRQVLDRDLQTGLEAGRVLYYREGKSGTVTVRVVAGTTALAIDGKVDASDRGDMLTQVLLAHVPLLLHSEPRTAAVIGLGSGVTAGAALVHPIERLDVLEISPEVVEASDWFSHVNHRPLQDPRTRLVIGDGRTHLLYGARQYDVIVSEPSNPWMAGLASLFTRDFFQAARERLAPGGVFCQWAHTYDISDADLRSIVATFASVFPDGLLWLVGDSDILLIGTERDTGARLDVIRETYRRPGVAADLERAGVRDVFSLLSLVAGGRELLTAYGGSARIQTDLHMPLEFSAPRHALGAAGPAALPTLLAIAGGLPLPRPAADALASAGPEQWRNRGAMLLRAESYSPAMAAFSRALDGAPQDSEALEGFVRASLAVRRQEEAQQRLRAIVEDDPGNFRARAELSRVLAARGAIDEALRVLAHPAAAATREGRVHLLEQAAAIASDTGDLDRLARAVRALQHEQPDHPAALFYAATERYLRGSPEEAVVLAARAAAGREDPRAHNLLGAAHATLGRPDEARLAFEQALAVHPRDPTGYINLALLEMEAGRAGEAARLFAEALTLDPASPAARTGLAQALARRGSPRAPTAQGRR